MILYPRHRRHFVIEIKIEKRRFYEDQERYEQCSKCKLSRKEIATFAKEKRLNRETLRDWINAYNNIHGKFININTVFEKENNIIEKNYVRVNILSGVEKINKSSL